ncbi:hypothetical protein NN561_020223 [Cricetulus griseus]
MAEKELPLRSPALLAEPVAPDHHFYLQISGLCDLTLLLGLEVIKKKNNQRGRIAWDSINGHDRVAATAAPEGKAGDALPLARPGPYRTTHTSRRHTERTEEPEPCALDTPEVAAGCSVIAVALGRVFTGESRLALHVTADRRRRLRLR